MDELDKATVPVIGKMDSFYGNRSVVISSKLLKKIKSNNLINGLYITDIGFYPHAKNHFRKRENGIKENILIYCIDGQGSIQIKEQKYKITANSYFVIPCREPHIYWASETSPWSIYWLHFGGAKSSFFEKSFSQVIPVEPSSSSRIDDRIKLFNEILTVLELGFSNENVDFANLCLNSLLASFFYLDTYMSVKGFQSSDPVDRSIFFMQENINKCIKIKDIADHVKLSESHFSKIFKSRTGTSPVDYFINLKMQEAIRLLTNQSLRIKEVAYILGYDDQYYFSRIFTSHIGASPTTFVKMSRKS